MTHNEVNVELVYPDDKHSHCKECYYYKEDSACVKRMPFDYCIENENKGKVWKEVKSNNQIIQS